MAILSTTPLSSRLMVVTFIFTTCIALTFLPAYALAAPGKIKINQKDVKFLGDCNGKIRATQNGGFNIKLNQAFLTESTDKVQERKICMIKLPLSLPTGFKLSISGVAVAGLADIAENGKAIIALRHRFAGAQGMQAVKEIGFTGAIEDFQIKSAFKNTKETFSNCGGEVIFKTSLTTQALNGTIAVGEDSSIVYSGQFKPCDA